MGALAYSKNSQYLHVGSLGYYEHFSQLCQHPISNRNRVKSHGIDTTFESLLNFKRSKPSRKSGKFPKILS
jgi:hypothetical protein